MLYSFGTTLGQMKMFCGGTECLRCIVEAKAIADPDIFPQRNVFHSAMEFLYAFFAQENLFRR